MVAKKNRLNLLLANQAPKYKKALSNRYETATMDSNKLSFMERLVLDSRQVAEAHVGGLSTPQQVLIGILLYYDIHDRATDNSYKNKIKGILKDRISSFYNELKTPLVVHPTQTNYYSLIHIPTIAQNIYGDKAANHLVSKYEYLEFLIHLVTKYHVILLPGAGFDADPWTLRISLANLTDVDYPLIGKALNKAIGDMVAPALI
jgi:aspartate 4-decarboxylase